METSAFDRIHAELETEARIRTIKTSLLFATLIGILGIYAGKYGLRSVTAPQDLLAQVLVTGFGLFGVVMLVQPGLRLGPWTARGLAGLALVSPLLAMNTIGTPDALVGPRAYYGCTLSIAVGGLVGLLLMRGLLGVSRRRFGGANLMQGVSAAMTATLGMGLSCPRLDGTHLVTHVLGAALVVVVFRPLLLNR